MLYRYEVEAVRARSVVFHRQTNKIELAHALALDMEMEYADNPEVLVTIWDTVEGRYVDAEEAE